MLNTVAAPVRMLKYSFEGGIGDVMNILSQMSVQPAFDALGVRLMVAYGGPGVNDCGWRSLLRDEFFSRNPLFTWVEDPVDLWGSKEAVPAWGARVLDGFSKVGYRVNLLDGEKESLHTVGDSPLEVVMQLHDTYGEKKQWGLDRYRELVLLIKRKYPSCRVWLVDGPQTQLGDKFDIPGVVSTIRGWSMAQLIHLIQRADVVVGVDSWVKYVARWKKVSQVIMAHNVGYLTPDDMFKRAFYRIVGQPEVRIVGATFGQGVKVESIVSVVKEIPVGSVFAAFCSVVE